MDVFQIAEAEQKEIPFKRQHVGPYFGIYIYIYIYIYTHTHTHKRAVYSTSRFSYFQIYSKYSGAFFYPKIGIFEGLLLNLVIKSKFLPEIVIKIYKSVNKMNFTSRVVNTKHCLQLPVFFLRKPTDRSFHVPKYCQYDLFS